MKVRLLYKYFRSSEDCLIEMKQFGSVIQDRPLGFFVLFCFVR